MQGRVQRQRNPFRFGAIARDDDFADREREVRELSSDAINGQDVVVFAARRVGKSSLVAAVMRELIDDGVLVADVDLWKISTKEKLAEALATAIYADIARFRDRAAEKAFAPFRGLRVLPTMTVDPDTGGLSFTFSAGSAPEDIDATLERLLELPAELGADQGKQVALIFDEFQEIGTIGADLTKLMRSVFQQQADVSHIYLGSKRHLMEEIFNDPNEPFWRSAKKMELGPIPSDQFAAFIRKRFADTGKSVDPDVVERVLEATQGHPYATQRLCYQLWQETEPGETADMEAFEAAFAAVLVSEDAHFALIWEEASTVQRQLLEALAADPGHPFRGEYQRKHRLPVSGTIQRPLRTLTERETVKSDDDKLYRISEPFLAEWIVAKVTPRPAGREPA